MKTKNIFKTLALAMMMPAMLLTTACSSEDDFTNNTVNSQSVAKKGYPFPVTVNVSRQGDEGTTRATYNESTKKLEFSAGDKLFVKGSDNSDGGAGKFAGTLDYDAVSGEFSGTVTTQNQYTGTIDDLMASAVAFLLPDGYGSYEFFSVSGSGADATVNFNLKKAFALTKADAVEQFSLEYTASYSSGFALAPMTAIASFTISGLTANKEVAVSFGISLGTISGNVTTSAEGVATFAVGVSPGNKLENCTLTVDGNNIAMPTKTVVPGYIYNISRSVPKLTKVTWNSTNVFNNSHQDDALDKWNRDPLTYEGITISLSGPDVSNFYPYSLAEENAVLVCYGEDGDSFTFTAPSGKKFTKIEINNNGYMNFDAAYGGWTKPDYNKIVWSGTAANALTLGTTYTNASRLNSIVFTLKDE